MATLVLSGCSLNNSVTRFGWPEGVTPQATKMRDLWSWSVVAALAMGVLVWSLTFWTVTFHRKKGKTEEFPRQTGYNMALELTYTVIPFIIISILFYFTVVVQNYVNDHTKKADVVVDVTAFQWNWKFGYNAVDGVDYVDHAKMDKVAAEAKALKDRKNEEGEARPGPDHGKPSDDISYLQYDKIENVGSSTEVPILVLPTNQRIEFRLASADVDPLVLGRRLPVQARCSPVNLTRTRPTRSSRSTRSRRKGRSSAAARKCAVPTTQ